MCSSSTPSGRGFPWRSMSGNSGSALDASGTWEHKTAMLYHILTKSTACIKYVNNNIYKASSLLNSPRNCWYCWTCVLMSTCPDPCCCCCWPAPAAVPLVIPSTLCTGFNLIWMQKEVTAVKTNCHSWSTPRPKRHIFPCLNSNTLMWK